MVFTAPFLAAPMIVLRYFVHNIEFIYLVMPVKQ